jgi:hypothetical protein
MDVSVYFSANSLHIVVGTATRNGVTLEQFNSEQLPDGVMINGIITAPDALISFLENCNQQWGPFKQNATVIVESNTIRTKRLDLPALRESQMMPYLRSELVSLMEENANDIVDYAEIGTDPATGATKALGVVAGRVQIENYAQVTRQAGFNLKRIDVGANSLAKLPQLLPVLREGICMLGIIDGNSLAVAYYHGGEYVLARRYRLLAAPATDERRTEIAGYLSAMLQFQKSQNRHLEVQTIFFTGVPTDRINLLNQRAAYLGVPIVSLDMPQTINLRGKAAFDSNSFELSAYLYNIGSLLRN